MFAKNYTDSVNFHTRSYSNSNLKNFNLEIFSKSCRVRVINGLFGHENDGFEGNFAFGVKVRFRYKFSSFVLKVKNIKDLYLDVISSFLTVVVEHISLGSLWHEQNSFE